VSAARPTLLVIQHVPWEGPHRILDACNQLEVRTVEPLAGDALPSHTEVSGVLVMGGPMNVDEVERYSGLTAEREWLVEAVEGEMPILGICLGAQLLARALGGEVKAGEGPEVGFAPVEIHESSDPIVGALAPSAPVLHWHGDLFDLPDGAVPLASSDQTRHQAFRHGNAWGLLFHAEADAALIDRWLAEPTMRDQAVGALGANAPALLRRQAREAEPHLVARSAKGFQAFADLLTLD
jgi:GMP synthase (glutamine-hydrolysing)